jgi:FAD/FMN-containing dehydrogenase/Fe-S oxidoreductase
MIPRLGEVESIGTPVRAFLDDVRARGFAGDVRTDYASRIVASTDNSIYQFVPAAICAPRSHDDVVHLLTALGTPAHRKVTVSARGGGTGTNAQSLTDGIVVDLSRHMTAIGTPDLKDRTVRVQPGVVLDTLNRALGPHGMMFAPTVSTGDRATIGGMISTDAAGKGSRIHGKTSSHVVELTTVLVGGTSMVTQAMDDDALRARSAQDDVAGRVHREVDAIVSANLEEIRRVFPDLNRFVSGYNLDHIRRSPVGTFDLNPLLCGSEGTLGIVTSAVLRLTPIPAHRAVVVLKYRSFDEALGSADLLAKVEPSAIETMDETLLKLVRDDEAYVPVAHVFAEPVDHVDHANASVRAINLVEFIGDERSAIEAQVAALVAMVAEHGGEPDAPIGAYVTASEAERTAFWTLRKRAVGILGALPGRRKPVAFVEDTVVPPTNLRAFVREFRAILDENALLYGMFGHVDVGVLHVRPALDMRDIEDVERIRTISDRVAQLVRSYGGVIWGEHGKGVRGEYNPLFFGDRLYGAMREIKRVFDPWNQLNPGKIASAAGTDTVLLTIDATSRGVRDRQIAPSMQMRFDDTIRCNGNGACHSENVNYIMCPSWKGTRDRRHTPKGRAGVMREWLRMMSNEGVEIGAHGAHRANGVNQPGGTSITGAFARLINGWHRARGQYDFSHEVYESMHGCLACKACAGQCPVRVDVPDFRAAFLQAYHDRYPRRLRDHLVARLERSLPRAGRAPGIANAVSGSPPVRWMLERMIGLVDVPPMARPTLAQRLRDADESAFSIDALDERSVVILPDAFTWFYTPEVVMSTIRIVRALGAKPVLHPYFENGKPSQVKGFTRRFHAIATRVTDQLQCIAATGATMIGLEPAVTLTYRDEYVRALGERATSLRVHLLQEWLVEALEQRDVVPADGAAFRLLGHCTERAMERQAMAQWSRVFERCNARLDVLPAGCCGMCGAYGHEREHAGTSRGIYDMSWSAHVRADGDVEGELLTTGYSCRSQVKRIDGVTLRHPVEALAERLACIER